MFKKVIESRGLPIDTRGVRAQDRERIYQEIAFELSIQDAEKNMQNAPRRAEDAYLPHGLAHVPANHDLPANEARVAPCASTCV